MNLRPSGYDDLGAREGAPAEPWMLFGMDATLVLSESWACHAIIIGVGLISAALSMAEPF